MAALLAACGGFLVAVLWMDLMFDVQAYRLAGALGRERQPVSALAANDATVASIAAYYKRVTTDASPMNRLIAAVMVVTLAGSAWRIWSAHDGRFGAVVALALAAMAVGLAGARVVPNAVRLGARVDEPTTQAELAYAIMRDHRRCFLLMLAFTALQIRGALP